MPNGIEVILHFNIDKKRFLNPADKRPEDSEKMDEIISKIKKITDIGQELDMLRERIKDGEVVESECIINDALSDIAKDTLEILDDYGSIDARSMYGPYGAEFIYGNHAFSLHFDEDEKRTEQSNSN